MNHTLTLLTALLLALLAALHAAETPKAVGASGRIGCHSNPKPVAGLEITKPGVYDDYLVDGRWAGGSLVKITANDGMLRNCAICPRTECLHQE